MGGTIPTNGLKWSNPFRFVFLNETLMYIFTFWDLLDAGNSIQKGTCILAAQHVVLYVLPQHFWRLQVMQRKIGLELQRNNMSTAVPGFERPRKTCFTYSTSKGNFHKWWFIWHSFRHGSTIFANFFLVEKQKRAPHMQQKYLLKHRHLMFGPFCGVAFERYSLRHLQKNTTSFERWSPKGLGQTQPALVIFNWPLATEEIWSQNMICFDMFVQVSWKPPVKNQTPRNDLGWSWSYQFMPRDPPRIRVKMVKACYVSLENNVCVCPAIHPPSISNKNLFGAKHHQTFVHY